MLRYGTLLLYLLTAMAVATIMATVAVMPRGIPTVYITLLGTPVVREQQGL